MAAVPSFYVSDATRKSNAIASRMADAKCRFIPESCTARNQQCGSTPCQATTPEIIHGFGVSLACRGFPQWMLRGAVSNVPDLQSRMMHHRPAPARMRSCLYFRCGQDTNDHGAGLDADSA
jgi:hypothetical protein